MSVNWCCRAFLTCSYCWVFKGWGNRPTFCGSSLGNILDTATFAFHLMGKFSKSVLLPTHRVSSREEAFRKDERAFTIRLNKTCF